MDEQLEHQIKNYLQEVRFTVTSDPFSFFFSEEARAKRQSTREETVYNAQRIQEERARNDFASVWPNVSTDGGGVMDANVPAWWEAEYRRLLARKEAAVVAV